MRPAIITRPLLLLCLLVAGCVAPGGPTAPAVDNRSVSQPAPNVIDFVSKAAVGESTTLSDGTVKITVVGAYYSATGHSCRQYAVTNDKGSSQQRVACNVGPGWMDVRPLIAGDAVDSTLRAQ